MKELFKIEESLSPRMQEVRKHDIQTHFADCGDYPWMAIPMNLARQNFSGHDGDFTSIPEITASIGRLLEECNMCFYGDTKEQVEEMALNRARHEERKGAQDG